MTILQCRLFSCFFIIFKTRKSDFLHCQQLCSIYAPFYKICKKNRTCLTLNVVCTVCTLYICTGKWYAQFSDTISRVGGIYLLLCTMQRSKIALNIFIQYFPVYICYEVLITVPKITRFLLCQEQILITFYDLESFRVGKNGTTAEVLSRQWHLWTDFGTSVSRVAHSQPPVTSVNRFWNFKEPVTSVSRF